MYIGPIGSFAAATDAASPLAAIITTHQGLVQHLLLVTAAC